MIICHQESKSNKIIINVSPLFTTNCYYLQLSEVEEYIIAYNYDEIYLRTINVTDTI